MQPAEVNWLHSDGSPNVVPVAEELPRVLVLSSSLLIDRIFLHTGFLKALSRQTLATVWAASLRNPHFRPAWSRSPVAVEEFPAVGSFKEFPYNYLRWLNEFAWDFRLRSPGRSSMFLHVRRKSMLRSVKALRLPARVLATLKLEETLETRLEEVLLTYPRSVEAMKRLQQNSNDVLVTTGPFQFEQPAVVAAAKNLGIRTLAMIPSWDNISTKGRMVFSYDGFIVWSEQTKRELESFYPYARKVPIYVVGAPQFDVFFNPQFYLSREEFARRQGLKPELPIIVYAIGSPNFLRGEPHGALDFAERVCRGDLGDVQVIVRPHPLHDKGELIQKFRPFAPRVIVQRPVLDNSTLLRSQDAMQINEWVNTFRHADVVLNLSSTVTVDAAIFDRPVININYDPTPGQPQQQLIKEINQQWYHFKPIAESGGTWLVNNSDEMIEAVRTYLAQPDLHRRERRWIAEFVCQYLDGQCGERMAEAIAHFAQSRTAACKAF